MAENPPLNRIYVLGYSANDRDYPIVSLNADPRVAGYQVPKDLSACPDKRYPNHVFTGAQPISGDERVRHVWEILPSPYVPFTRYDDDLGPVQGRRRSVKNEGQVASREADKQVTYDAREGSAIVYTELEEAWSIKTDEDGNSLFPIRDRDFYDERLGPVQERRQLVSVTGEEQASLTYDAPTITQIDYEPYNEFLVFKIIRTYSLSGPARNENVYDPSKGNVSRTSQVIFDDKNHQASLTEANGTVTQTSFQAINTLVVDKIVEKHELNGPQLVGNATDNDGQLITVTTQRKRARDYVPKNPSATKTVEASREDSESLIERVIDTPEVFSGRVFSSETSDPTPEKFRSTIPSTTTEESLAGTATTTTLSSGDISKSEQQVNKFVKRIRRTFRNLLKLPQILTQKATNNEGQIVTVTETLQIGDTTEVPSAKKTVESEALGNGSYLVRKTEVPEIFNAKVFRKTKEDLTPQKFKALQEESAIEETIEGTAKEPLLDVGEFSKSEQQVNKFLKRTSTTFRDVEDSVILNEYVLTNNGQVGTRTLTLASGEQTLTPSATLVDANIESLGDGRTVKAEVEVPNVFSNKTITATKTDSTPEKFRATQKDTTIEESVAGTIESSLDLDTGEFRKSEQQVTEFIKRTSVTSRDTTTTSDLTEFVVTPQGQVATRTLTLSPSEQTLEPNARLIDGSIEELGDGRTIKTEVKVDITFDNKTLSASKPDVLPERFRASTPSITTQETVEQSSVSVPELDSGDLEKSETRLTDFTVRKSTTARDVSSIPELQGVDYEESFDVQIPYTEKIQQTIPTGSAEAVPLDDQNFLVREYNPNDIGSYLSAFLQTYPTTISMNLPRVLESVTVEWDEKQQSGEYENTPYATGILYQFSSSDKGESSAFHSATPLVSLNFKDVWSQNIPATVHIFFLKNPVTAAAILTKTGSQEWPTFKPKSHVITGKGVEVRATATAAVSISLQQSKPAEFGGYSDQSRQGDYSRSVTPITINIPPCLHGVININETKTLDVTATTEAKTAAYGILGSLTQTSAATSNDTAFIKGNLGATSPTSIPTNGTYLIESSVEFFKYGFSIVKATTINASVFE